MYIELNVKPYYTIHYFVHSIYILCRSLFHH